MILKSKNWGYAKCHKMAFFYWTRLNIIRSPASFKKDAMCLNNHLTRQKGVIYAWPQASGSLETEDSNYNSNLFNLIIIKHVSFIQFIFYNHFKHMWIFNYLRCFKNFVYQLFNQFKNDQRSWTNLKAHSCALLKLWLRIK